MINKTIAIGIEKIINLAKTTNPNTKYRSKKFF
jgi:hypothetical protein